VVSHFVVEGRLPSKSNEHPKPSSACATAGRGSGAAAGMWKIKPREREVSETFRQSNHVRAVVFGSVDGVCRRFAGRSHRRRRRHGQRLSPTAAYLVCRGECGSDGSRRPVRGLLCHSRRLHTVCLLQLSRRATTKRFARSRACEASPKMNSRNGLDKTVFSLFRLSFWWFLLTGIAGMALTAVVVLVIVHFLMKFW
jgi:hypothetical protein